ncbi:hypothetical protein, partial [Nocardia sp. NPDC058497]|uniref:hypothetical protein n=1 Tax=Nocardia sp. NPDC058497 TaxID=3346529 RepID=UPI00364CD327
GKKRDFRAHGVTRGGWPACEAEVLVRKSSARQTSVQWAERPDTHCPVFAELSANGARPGRPDSCPSLERTIKWAVDEGVLEVPE